MKKLLKQPHTTLVALLRQMTIISGMAALLTAVMLIITFLQLRSADPLNTPALSILNKQLLTDPNNVQLQQEIRQLDLLARKAFFTSQWQIRTGGYILAFSLLVLVICVKTLEMVTPSVPGISTQGPENLWLRRRVTRRWVALTGITFLLAALIMAWYTYDLVKIPVPGSDTAAVQQKAAPLAESPQGVMPAVETTDSLLSSGDTAVAVSAAEEGYPSQKEIMQNFTTFRGFGGNGVDFHRNIPVSWDGSSGKNIRWKTEIPLPGYNSPIIWNDKVFLSGAKENRRAVYCLDIATGKILWTTDLSSIPGSPGPAPKVIAETGQAAPTMTTDGRRVYVVFANGDLAAIDMAGKITWSLNLGLPKNHYGHSSSLIMYRDLLLVQYDQSGAGKVMALEGRSGKKVWETARNVKVSWASPVLVNTGSRMELILAAEPMVASYDPATGRELWKVDCISGEVGPSVAYANGMVFSVNDYSKVAAIKLGDPPKEVWENEDYLSDVPSPVAVNDLLFVVTSYGAVACFAAADGTQHRVAELDKSVYASPMIAEGRLYILDKQGTMHIFKASAAMEEIGKASLGEGSSCTPAFTDGKIFIRGNKHLYCIGK